jgi:hypothetical protein
MKKHILNLGPSPATQTILDTGRGKVARVTLSHGEETTETVTFYDRDGVQLAQYKLHPMGSPWSITFANRDAFSFENGLRVNTGNCTMNLVFYH